MYYSVGRNIQFETPLGDWGHELAIHICLKEGAIMLLQIFGHKFKHIFIAILQFLSC